MSAERAAVQPVEVPVFMPCGDDVIFGVHSRPTAAPRDTGFVHFQGRGTGGSWGRKRFTLKLCRRLAALGFDALRLDYHGVGESTGSTGTLSTTRPFTEDVGAAVRWMEEQGIGGVVVSGTCFGGRSVLAHAPEVARLRGVVLISANLTDEVRQGVTTPVVMRWVLPWHKLRRVFRPRVWRGLLDADRRRSYIGYMRSLRRAVPATIRARRSTPYGDHWVSPRYLGPLEALADRGVPVLFVFGREDSAYAQFEEARRGRLGDLLERAGGGFRVEVLEGKVHGATSMAPEEAVIDLVCEWMAALPAGAGEPDRVGAP